MLSREVETFLKKFIREFKKRETINFNRLKPYYNKIKGEYSKVVKNGSSKQTHFSIVKTESPHVHPRKKTY